MKYFCISFLILASMGGCSAKHWGGEAGSKLPGISFERNLFATKFNMTSNGDTKVRKIAFTRDKGENKDNITVTIEDLEYSQNVADVMEKIPAQLEALAKLQRTQVEYIAVVMSALKEMVESMAPALTFSEGLIKAMSKAIDKTDVVFPTSQPVN